MKKKHHNESVHASAAMKRAQMSLRRFLLNRKAVSSLHGTTIFARISSCSGTLTYLEVNLSFALHRGVLLGKMGCRYTRLAHKGEGGSLGKEKGGNEVLHGQWLRGDIGFVICDL